MSAKRVTSIQLTVSEEAALVIKELLYALNWDQFAFAEGVVEAINSVEPEGDVTITYNEASGQFDKDE